MKKWTAFLLTFGLLFCGCAPSGTQNLMLDVPERIICLAEAPGCSAEAADFGIRLLQNTMTGEDNTLISPLSVLSALAMTANGADGETLAQMDAVLGMPAGDRNAYLYSYMDGQSGALKPANSIWFTDRETFSVNQEFLETNANFYQADIFRTPMDDTTLTEINSWVKEKTDGMIPEILDQIPEAAVMYLVNALAFEAEWEDTYDEYAVHPGTFTTEDGTGQAVDMMYSEERHYLEDEYATGFLKYYDGRQYAFAALLPKEGVSVSEYVQSLTGETLLALLGSPETVTVNAGIPKFETEFHVEMSEVLTGMGMTDAFDVGLADFSRLGSCAEDNIFISRVLHKTFLSVAEQGTKAGAATVVEAPAGAAYIEEDIKTVTLDRPFVYMLIDCEQNLPFFIGTMMDMES